MPGGKWISELEATTPVTDAARHVLTVRLEEVRDDLQRALHETAKDPEYVHQLRVGTRRARAALDIFACCLPPKVFKVARQHLRDIRRVASAARDWDVFLATLTQWRRDQGKKLCPGLDCLVGYVVAKRATAQAQLEEAGKDYPFAFHRFLAETVAAVGKPDDPLLGTLLDLALPQLSGLLRQLDEAAGLNLEDYQQLHQVRILGKRLRYAMEVFADCFASEFREQIYPAVEKMQEVLGSANDSFVACRRLEVLLTELQTYVPRDLKRYRPGLEGLLQFHQTRLPQERQRFQDWWASWRQSGSEAAFFALLKDPDGPAEELAPPHPAPFIAEESPPIIPSPSPKPS